MLHQEVRFQLYLNAFGTFLIKFTAKFVFIFIDKRPYTLSLRLITYPYFVTYVTLTFDNADLVGVHMWKDFCNFFVGKLPMLR